MKRQIANYTVVIERQKRLGTNKNCYMAYIPLLGIATEADSLEQIQKDIRSFMQFHIDCLVSEGESIPIEKDAALVTRSEVILPKGAILVQ